MKESKGESKGDILGSEIDPRLWTRRTTALNSSAQHTAMTTHSYIYRVQPQPGGINFSQEETCPERQRGRQRGKRSWVLSVSIKTLTLINDFSLLFYVCVWWLGWLIFSCICINWACSSLYLGFVIEVDLLLILVFPFWVLFGFLFWLWSYTGLLGFSGFVQINSQCQCTVSGNELTVPKLFFFN